MKLHHAMSQYLILIPLILFWVIDYIKVFTWQQQWQQQQGSSDHNSLTFLRNRQTNKKLCIFKSFEELLQNLKIIAKIRRDLWTSSVDLRLETGAFFGPSSPGVDTGIILLDIELDNNISLMDFCFNSLWGGSLGVPVTESETAMLGSILLVEISFRGLCGVTLLSDILDTLDCCFSALWKEKKQIINNYAKYSFYTPLFFGFFLPT